MIQYHHCSFTHKQLNIYFLTLFIFSYCKPWPINFSVRLRWKFGKSFLKAFSIFLVNVCAYDVISNHIYKEKNTKTSVKKLKTFQNRIIPDFSNPLFPFDSYFHCAFRIYASSFLGIYIIFPNEHFHFWELWPFFNNNLKFAVSDVLSILVN